jgi:hypothetical protein
MDKAEQAQSHQQKKQALRCFVGSDGTQTRGGDGPTYASSIVCGFYQVRANFPCTGETGSAIWAVYLMPAPRGRKVPCLDEQVFECWSSRHTLKESRCDSCARNGAHPRRSR